MGRRLKNWLDSYIEYTQYTETPEKFHFWTGVWVIAAALRRKVWIDQIYFKWYPNVFVLFVAPPAIVSKSTTAGIGEQLLREVEGINFGPDCATWQYLTQAFAESTESFPLDPDADPLQTEFIPMSCITISSSELGSFLDTRDRQMLDVLVDLWDGKQGAWTKATKTQGQDEIENPWINILACTTPSWLLKNMDEVAIQGGFFSRNMILYGDKKRHFVPYPSEVVPHNMEKLRTDLVHDLKEIARMIGPYELTPEAIKYGSEWYENHWKHYNSISESDRSMGHYGRMQTHAHKIAMIHSAARNDDLIIEVEDLEKAISLLKDVSGDVSQALGHWDEVPESRNAEKIVECVQRAGRMEESALYRLLWKTLSRAEFQAAVKAALATRLLIRMEESGIAYLKCPDPD